MYPPDKGLGPQKKPLGKPFDACRDFPRVEKTKSEVKIFDKEGTLRVRLGTWPEKKFDLLVFVGRFQPFHNGHKRVIDRALELSDKVLVLIGSAGSPRTIRNPWTYEERKQMIHDAYLDRDLVDPNPATSRIVFSPLYDKTYNDAAWIEQVQAAVKKVALGSSNFNATGLADQRIGLIGYEKDHTSYYLNLFPQWDNVAVEPEGECQNATDIRNKMFRDGYIYDYDVPSNVLTFINSWSHSDIYEQLWNEWSFIQCFKKSWENSPYPPTFQTVDALVEQSGHILLVRRRNEPGKGLLALPGGYRNPNERLEGAMLRELKEETKIKVPLDVLKGSIIKRERYDDPHRSERGCFLTEAYHIKLKDQTSLPKVKGSDDAEKAFWMPISELKEELFFEDHYFIIQDLLKLS